MNQFTFEGSQKRLFLGMIAVGLACMAATFLFDDDALHTRFWTNFLHNTVFFTGIAFVILFFYCASTLAYAGWFVNFKRVFEAYALYMPVGLGFLLVIIAGIWGHFHHLYHWTDTSLLEVGGPNYDKVVAGKSGFINKNWYTFGTLITVGIWSFCAIKLRGFSLDEDSNPNADHSQYVQFKKYAAFFMFFGAFSSAAMIWQWIMSIDVHWYSTMFAWYATASWLVSALALTIATLIYLKSKGYYESVLPDHFHDLGKYIFGFSVFWTYLWFDQFMLIWYANNGEETVYFQHRFDHYSVLFYANLVINFVLPFLILMRNSVKRKAGIMMFAAIILFFGHWLDFFLMIKPGAYLTAQEALAHGAGHGDAAHGAVETGFALGNHFPGLLEVGTFLGFLGLFLFLGFRQLAKASLEPKNDPYLGEALHHHVI